MLRKTLSLILLLVAALGVASAQVQNNTHWYFASNYGQWSLQGQRANTYLFSPGNICLVPQVGGGVFFPFNTNAPVWIADVNSSNSETVTPSAVIQNSSQCGVTISPSNSHYTFSFRSGTGGLQEAINALGSSTYPVVLYIDPLWYQYAAAVPSTTPAAILAAASCKTSVYLVDITTSPDWTGYTCPANGSGYVANGLGSATGNLSQFFGYKASSNTAISAPAAPTLAVASGGSVTAGTYRVCQALVNALGGESLCSTDSSSTVTTSGGNLSFTVTKPAAATGAVAWRLYVSAASGGAGSEIHYSVANAGCTASALWPVSACAMSSTGKVTALVTGTSKVPNTATGYPATVQASNTILAPFQTGWGPFAATGVESTGTAYVLGEFLVPAGYLNSLDKKIRVCGTFTETPVINSAPTYTITAANARGQSANTLVTWVIPASTLTAVANTVNFCTDITVAVTGASGTAQVHGSLTQAVASTGNPYAGTGPLLDGNTAAVTVGDFTKNIYFQIVSTPATANITQAQLQDLSIQILN